MSWRCRLAVSVEGTLCCHCRERREAVRERVVVVGCCGVCEIGSAQPRTDWPPAGENGCTVVDCGLNVEKMNLGSDRSPLESFLSAVRLSPEGQISS